MNFYSEIIPFCPKDHKLTWQQAYLDFNNPCSICKSSVCNYSRWICKQCSQQYCVNCKKPQVYDKRCPLNHELVKKDLLHNTCDACRKPIKGKGWRDVTCDFDLCEKCIWETERED
jgi:hypothetical protein